MSFIKLTDTNGLPVFIRKDLIGAFAVFNEATHVLLTIDEVDYPVKETPEQISALMRGEIPNENVSNNSARTGVRRSARYHHKGKGRPDRTSGVSV